jgi:TonB-dependent SusC/RagA subfamily outer membrane receptor
MTGCYNARVSIPGVVFPGSQIGLHPDEVTLAEIVKPKGYTTICIGKWHLGHREPFLPTKQGFDSYFGIPYSNDQLTTTSQVSNGGAYTNGISNLDPNDIATMNVLKGSSAAALYGSRASNGVIIITELPIGLSPIQYLDKYIKRYLEDKIISIK